jgi:hypothetical protein
MLCWLGQPYTWQSGDLLTVPRSSLPVLNADAARALIEEVETVFEKHGAPSP